MVGLFLHILEKEKNAYVQQLKLCLFVQGFDCEALFLAVAKGTSESSVYTIQQRTHQQQKVRRVHSPAAAKIKKSFRFTGWSFELKISLTNNKTF